MGPAEGSGRPSYTPAVVDGAVEFLVGEPVLLLLAVVAIGAAAGSVRVRGASIGPAAALFAGLAVGSLDERLSGTAGLGLLRELGLVLFTYTVGLASGPTFVAGLRRGGAAVVAVTVALVAALAAACAGVAALLDLTPAERSGLFAGSTTNTPSLQAAVDGVAGGDPVVAYSLAYPSAVVSMLVVIGLVLGRRVRPPGRLRPPVDPPQSTRPESWTIHVSESGLPTLRELRERHPGIGFSRIEHDGVVAMAGPDRYLSPGDAVVVVGPPDELARFCDRVGERNDRHLPLDRSSLDFRRVLVSDRRLAGVRLGDLALQERHGVTVTRVRRGDADLVATDDTELELGDRVRVVGPPDRIAAAGALFGDSERSLSEVDALGFAAGLVAGLAVGAVSVPLPGVDLRLGAGGGTLVVGLVLGVISRTGPVTWQIPHGANLVLRQFGVLLFLAAAGLGSGATFADAVVTRDGAVLFAAGVVVAFGFALVAALAIQAVLRRDVVEASGLVAGVETQPAALAFANDRTAGDPRVAMAYALVFPIAMVAKIVAVQFLV